jgi:hypothetical protein
MAQKKHSRSIARKSSAARKRAKSAGVSLGQTLAAINERTSQMEATVGFIKRELDTLFRMTAKMPDGRTLINVVGTILAKVERL